MREQQQTSEWSGTKLRLVDAGVALMRSRGFNATSLDQICAAAGVTKGGFFHYFKSKDEIAEAAITRFDEGKESEYQQAEFRKLKDPLERVFGRLEFVKEASGGESRVTKGCLIGTLAQELAFTNPELRDACRTFFQRVCVDFENDLGEAKALYAPTADFEPKNVAALYVTIVQGSILMAKANENNAILINNLDEFRKYLEVLFGGQSAAKR